LKSAGKLIAYVFNPSNWGKGFRDGLRKIMAENGAELVNDVKIFGNQIGTSFSDAAFETVNGSAKKISSLIPDFFSSPENVKKAKDSGEKMGKGINAYRQRN
jgi:hypothetical protein